MVQLVTISPNELLPFITISYWEDYKLWESYHIKSFGTCMEACEATAEMIIDAERQVRMNYFKVLYNGQAIGYTVTFENCLYSFGINLRFRQAEILREWMYLIKQLLNYKFYCGLYSNNQRAIEFLKRNNMQVKSEDKDSGLVILVNQYASQS